MSTITALEPQKRKKDRVNLYIDGEFYCGLQLETALKLKLHVGTEIENNALLSAVQNSETLVAFEKCVDYLSRSMKTAKQIRDYLRKKGFSETVEERVVEKLKEYGYVNDELYARLYVEQNSSGKGKRRIKGELMRKGIYKETADEIAETVSDDKQTQGANALAEKYMRNKERTQRNLQKLYRFLLTRGFDFDLVKSIVQSYKAGEDDDWN